MDTYLIYSIRMGAWVAASGGTSDFRMAREFTRNAAMTYAARTRDHEGNPSAIPVRLIDIKQLSAEAPFEANS